MQSFNAPVIEAIPIFQWKQAALDPKDMHGVVRVRWGSSQRIFYSTYYTRVDQALWIWSLTTACIFLAAQFSAIDWYTQAIAWSILSSIATLVTNRLAWLWVKSKQLSWVVYSWSVLMLLGVALTDYGIFQSNGLILMNLCPLWLGLSSCGYVMTGLGARSRALVLMGALHALAIPCLSLVPGWQFLTTGVVMAGSLMFLAELQWDHR